MKHKVVFLLILVFNVLLVSAQSGRGGSFDIEGFKQKKATYIIEKVGLSDSEAKQFIPLMNELMDKKFELNRSMRQQSRALRDKQGAKNADYDRLLDEYVESQIKEAQLKKEYIQKFRKIISADKILKYLRAEDDFMKQTVNRGGRR